MIEEMTETFFNEEYEKALKAIEDAERRAKLPFFKALIYDMTGYDIASIDYLESRELIIVKFMDPYREDLVINIHMDSIEACTCDVCTCDVIRQTQDYLRCKNC